MFASAKKVRQLESKLIRLEDDIRELTRSMRNQSVIDFYTGDNKQYLGQMHIQKAILNLMNYLGLTYKPSKTTPDGFEKICHDDIC